MARGLTVGPVAAVILMFPCGAAASGFNPPVSIGSDLGAVQEAAVVMDWVGNPLVAFTAGDRVYAAYGINGFASSRQVDSQSGSGVVQDLPTLATTPTGVMYVAFRQQNGALARDVAWTNDLGGQFRPAALIPGSGHEGVARPSIEVPPSGEVLIGWSAEIEPGEGQVFISRGGGPAQAILSGTEASFCVDQNGIVHVVYTRQGDVYYSNNDGMDFSEREVRLTESAVTESAPQLAVTADGVPFVTYWAEGDGSLDLYVTGGSWRVKELITRSAPAAAHASLKVPPGRASYVVLFVRDGQVWSQTGMAGIPGVQEKVLPLTGGVELVDFAVDRAAYMHVVYIQWGELLYTNNAPLPHANFTADPASGEWPLKVTFDNESTGHVLGYRWDFGDGAQSLLRDPVHFYEAEGTYTVRLRVAGSAGAVDEMVTENLIVVGPKRNHLMVSDAAVYAGQKNVVIPVRATNDQFLQGFQIAATYDAKKLEFLPDGEFVGFESTVVQALEPEFIAPQLFPDDGYFILGVTFDMLPPITGKMAPPGYSMILVNIVVNIRSNVPNRSQAHIRLENDIGDPPISNIFTIQGGYTVYPQLHSGTVTIYRPDIENAGPVFLRGDANNSHSVEIADAVYVLAFLFAKGPDPYCMDAADFDDNQNVNIGDAIGVLSYLFRKTFPPAFPFPTPGLDPSKDALPACGES